MVFAFFSILFLLLLCFIYKIYRFYNYWTDKKVLGPKPKLLFGNYLDLNPQFKKNALQYKEWTHKYGAYYGIYEGRRKVLITSDPAMIKEILVTQSYKFNPRKHAPFVNGFDKMKTSVLFFSSGENWKHLRVKFSRFFIKSRLHKQMPLILVIVKDHITGLHGEYKQSCQVIDASRSMNDLAWKLIMKLTFGVNDDNYTLASKLRTHMQNFPSLKTQIFYSIFPWIRNVAKRMAQWNIIRQSSNETFYQSVFDEVLKKKNEAVCDVDLDDATDLYTYLLLVDKNVENFNTKIGNNIEEEIVGLCANMLFSGLETTANSLSAAVYCLSMYENVQNKVYNEIKDFENSFEDIDRFKYIDCVLRESARLFPFGLSAVTRKCVETTNVNGTKIDRGTYIIIDVLSVHANKQIWGNDAEEFNPDQWLDEPLKPGSVSWLSFGAGPRTCIGKNLALLQIKIAVIELLKKFRLNLVKNQDCLNDVGKTITFPKKFKINITLRN